MRTDGQAGRHDEANTRFSQFANAPKKNALRGRPCLSARDVVSATKSLFGFLCKSVLEFVTKSCQASERFVKIGSLTARLAPRLMK